MIEKSESLEDLEKKFRILEDQCLKCVRGYLSYEGCENGVNIEIDTNEDIGQLSLDSDGIWNESSPFLIGVIIHNATRKTPHNMFENPLELLSYYSVLESSLADGDGVIGKNPSLDKLLHRDVCLNDDFLEYSRDCTNVDELKIKISEYISTHRNELADNLFWMMQSFIDEASAEHKKDVTKNETRC